MTLFRTLLFRDPESPGGSPETKKSSETEIELNKLIADTNTLKGLEHFWTDITIQDSVLILQKAKELFDVNYDAKAVNAQSSFKNVYQTWGAAIQWTLWKLLIYAVQMCLGTDVDGIVGRHTKAAIAQFQNSNGLTADEQCGPLTIAALLKDAKIQNGDAAQAYIPPEPTSPQPAKVEESTEPDAGPTTAQKEAVEKTLKSLQDEAKIVQAKIENTKTHRRRNTDRKEERGNITVKFDFISDVRFDESLHSYDIMSYGYDCSMFQTNLGDDIFKWIRSVEYDKTQAIEVANLHNSIRYDLKDKTWLLLFENGEAVLEWWDTIVSAEVMKKYKLDRIFCDYINASRRT